MQPNSDISSRRPSTGASRTCSMPARGAANVSRSAPASNPPASPKRAPKTSSAACSTSYAAAMDPRHRADGQHLCMLSGECIKACDYGVNPRFLLAMARLAIAKAGSELPDRRRLGVERYRDLSRDVTVLSRLQLDGEVLERLGQKSASVSTPAEAPDFVFTLAAMCSRRRTSRCSPSISWMCSASPTR